MTFDSLDGLDGIVDGIAGKPEEEDYLTCFEDLTPFEVEYFVRDLQEFNLEEVGNPKWLTQHEKTEKLNWTAHNQAKEGYDEFVVDQFNTGEKLPTLIFDLCLIELWKDRIWPLVKQHISKLSSLRTYIPVYHEATVVNLLEICLYHRTSCEEAGDALVDLVDFCVRKLRHLLATPNSELVKQITDAKDVVEWDSVTALDEQFRECEFQVCMCVISVLRFLTDHRVAMPLAVTTRLLETHDVLLLLVPLMEKAPWVRKNRRSGRIEKFEEHKWEVVEKDDEGRLPKLHTQVWLTIYNLVMDSECRARYDLTNFRKENLLRLRRFINEVVVDQLPPLTNLHRTLEEMSISGNFTGAGMDVRNAAATPFVVELVAEARESLLRVYEGRWQDIADQQLRDVFVKETPEELKRLSQMISIPKEFLEAEPLPDPEETKNSGGDSSSIGERAQSSWYALLGLASVRSTASFFSSARWPSVPVDEVLILSAVPQPLPSSGGKLKLELRRTRHQLLPAANRGHASSSDRAVAENAFSAKRAPEGGVSFLLVVEAPGMELDVSRVKTLPYVSQKGANKSAELLRELLGKPGRQDLLDMYSDDVAEFSVMCGEGESMLSMNHVAGLFLTA